jgi:dienelactone hydrolase
MRKTAPVGDIRSFDRSRFEAEGMAHDVYRKGIGPAVVIVTEMPGLSPQVLGFADRVVALGCSVALPDLFGRAGVDLLTLGKPRRALYMLETLAEVCISREFNMFVSGRASPVTRWLRALAALEHERCGGPGVGVVGMCFTGGFALAMAADPRVLAPVLSQPSLPVLPIASHTHGIDCDADTLAAVAERCSKDGLKVLGLRFKGDPLVPGSRFRYLREKLGSGFVAVELEQRDGNPAGPLPHHHSVLTLDLVDEPGSPTHQALDQVLALFRDKLLVDA